MKPNRAMYTVALAMRCYGKEAAALTLMRLACDPSAVVPHLTVADVGALLSAAGIRAMAVSTQGGWLPAAVQHQAGLGHLVLARMDDPSKSLGVEWSILEVSDGECVRSVGMVDEELAGAKEIAIEGRFAGDYVICLETVKDWPA